MTASLLLNQVANEFGGDALNRIASTIGESPGKIRTALSDMLPVLLGGLASKAQTQEGAHELLDVIHRDHLDSEQYEHVADAIKPPDALGNLMSTGAPLLDKVLPGKTGAVSDWVASHAGIKPTASKSLMSLVLPLVLGLIGRRVGGGGASGLKNLLGRPLGFVQDAPAGLASILGLGGAASSVFGATPFSPSDEAPGGQGLSSAAAGPSPLPPRKWLVPLLLLLGLIALLLYFMNRNVPTPTQSAAPVATAPAANESVAGGGGLGAFIDRRLPNGVMLRIPANGVENKLLAFIEDPSQPVSPTTWFSFDRVEFDSSAATLKTSSQEQLRNIAEIMKAYPQVAVKFGGYTDNTGSPEQNLALSGNRASRAMNQVVALGVDPSRLTAEGYGEQHPVADNATAEGRQRNRRVDINVTAK